MCQSPPRATGRPEATGTQGALARPWGRAPRPPGTPWGRVPLLLREVLRTCHLLLRHPGDVSQLL